MNEHDEPLFDGLKPSDEIDVVLRDVAQFFAEQEQDVNRQLTKIEHAMHRKQLVRGVGGLALNGLIYFGAQLNPYAALGLKPVKF